MPSRPHHLHRAAALYGVFESMEDAALVLTDSGGLQEDTTALGASCLTLRKSTEPLVTISEDLNVLGGRESARTTQVALSQITRNFSMNKLLFVDPLRVITAQRVSLLS